MKRTYRLLLALTLTLLLHTVPARSMHAQGPIDWHEGTRLPGGDTISAAASDPTDPDRFWLATAGDHQGVHTYLYRSDDAGAHWTPMDGGLPDTCFFSGYQITLHPDGQHVAIGDCAGEGLWLSDDGGMNWRHSLSGHSTSPAIMAASDASVIYVVLHSNEGFAGLYRSGDGGSTWRRADAGLPAAYPVVSVHPADADRLFASYSTGTERLWQSQNGGRTWSPLPTHGLPVLEGEYGQCVGDVSHNPASLGQLWVVLSPANFLGGCDALPGQLFRSSDGGASWTAVLDDLWSYAPVFDPTNPQVMYAVTRSDGLYRSTNGGTTWARQGDWPGDDQRYDSPYLTIDRRDSYILYATPGSSSALQISYDAGRTWTEVTQPEFVNVFAPATPPEGGLLAGGEGGIYRSTDGVNWQAANGALPPRHRITALAVDPVDPARLYAGLEARPDGGKTPLVWRSDDRGRTWTPATSGTALDARVVALWVDPESPQTIYGGLETTWRDGPPPPLLRSLDGGDTWETALAGLPGSLSGLHHQGSALYASTPFGVYKSMDHAATWASASPLFPSAGVESTRIVLAGESGVLLAAAAGYDSDGNLIANGLFRSTNGGQTWQRGSGYPSDISFWRLVEADGGVYAAWVRMTSVGGSSVTEEGYLRSTDGGATWSPFMTPSCSDLVGSAPNGGLWFAVREGALLHSDATGQSWTVTGEGMRGGHTLTALAAAGDTVYAGTTYGELFRSLDRGQSWQYLPLSLAKSHSGACGFSSRIGQIRLPSSSSEQVYVGMEGFCGVYGGGGDGLYWSDDGVHWQHPITNGCVQDVALTARDPGTAWVLLEDAGLYRLDDSGAEWLGAPGVYHYALAVHPRNPDVMLVSVTGNPCIYRTVDGGTTWEGVQGQVELCQWNTALEELTFNPFEPDRVYGEGFASQDGGLTWSSPRGAPSMLAFNPDGAAIAYGWDLTDKHLQRSRDGGATWHSVGQWPGDGGIGSDVAALASTVGWGDPPRLYAATCDPSRDCRFWSALDEDFNLEYRNAYLPLLLIP